MKKLFFLSFILINVSMNNLTAQQEMTKTDSISYSVGVMFANNLQQQGMDELNLDIVMTGLKDALGDASKIDKSDAMKLLNEFITAKKETDMQKNAQVGIDFLAENAKKEGVVTLESGLQYEVLKEGNGPIPTASDKVTVHYHGTLIDGKVFDSSVDRGDPATFGVTQVIQGWVEALQLMPTGSKWRLFIPSDLAYGSRGAGGMIGPGAALIFDVELLGIK